MTERDEGRMRLGIDAPELDLGVFLKASKHLLSLLQKLDRHIAGGKPSTRWVLHACSKSSPALLEPAPRPRVIDKPCHGGRAMALASMGLRHLDEAATIPDGWPVEALDDAHDLAGVRDDVPVLFIDDFHVGQPEPQRFHLTGRIVGSVQTIRAERREFREFGEVVGRIEWMNIHNANAFAIFDREGNKIECRAPREVVVDTIKRTEVSNRVVRIEGMIRFDADGRPLLIDVDPERVFIEEPRMLRGLEELIGVNQGWDGPKGGIAELVRGRHIHP